MANTEINKISNSEYENLISKSFSKKLIKEKTIVSGKIISIENDIVTIDVGLKSEGRVPLNEFSRPGQNPEINVGDLIEVFIEDVDNSNGETKLSREKAIKHFKKISRTIRKISKLNWQKMQNENYFRK